MYTTDYALQEVKVEGSTGRSVEFNVPSNLVSAPLFVCPGYDNPKYLICQKDVKHGTDLNEVYAGRG